jgi:hypothetical protein
MFFEILNLNGDVYTLPSIQNFRSINEIKQWLITNTSLEDGNFVLTDLESGAAIISLSQLRKFLFEFEKVEQPQFVIRFL